MKVISSCVSSFFCHVLDLLLLDEEEERRERDLWRCLLLCDLLLLCLW